MLHTEIKFYRQHHKGLIAKYANKYIVISGKKIIGVYNSHSEAYTESIKTHELGTFLIQHVTDKKDIDS